MTFRLSEGYKPLIEFVAIVLVIGYSVMRKRKVNGQRERPEPSSAKFMLYLIAALVCGCTGWSSYAYMQNHHGDYANYLMMLGVMIGAPFGAGFLLGAIIEGLRVVFSGNRR
ncbi:hypothetical protein [Ferribacterium limneticum]|uniref:hypothetical protein n=1 Tax=Ferribacterium limneticum TaxID=76259 RepID=UPI001CFA946C|nr:hypothetical protein [Ferribacterium limneticum]UCV28926.1 hypothetical protein KI617_02135 [Ferribacterium limneticum]UCV32844.1 hypothetical protein KI608_02135 [Ferribacterium limneticum]